MSRLLFPIAILAFVSLGLPDGVLGVAWPSIRHTFGLALSQLGVLLTAATAGYLIASFGSGTLVLRLGVGRLLVASSVLMVVSLGIFALAPVWPAIVLAGFLSGLGGGAIDAGINGFAASSFSPRRTAWLHASYGAGAAIGPLVMTGVLTVGASWRLGYAAVTAVLIGMTAAFALTVNAWPGVRSGAMYRPRWPARGPRSTGAASPEAASRYPRCCAAHPSHRCCARRPLWRRWPRS
jgi:MFS family permease